MLLSSYNPYIPWDVDMLYNAIDSLRGTIGTAFNIGFWIFAVITGVYVAFSIVSRFGR